METFDVVIIGSGVVGSSVAYHLTEAGCTNILLIERESSQGKGSTGKSMGGVRAQFSTELNIRLSRFSIDFFSTYDERLGHPSGYKPQGYVFLATEQKHVDYLDTTFQLQRDAGLKEVQRVSRQDIAALLPNMRTDDVLCGNFCSIDGFVDPYSLMNGFTAVALDRGAKIWRDCEVTGIEKDAQGAISAVVTSKGKVATRTVVNAAGAWSAQIAKMIDADLPVEPLRRMLVPTEPTELIPHSSPMVVDMSTGFHFRPEGAGILLAWNDASETPGFKTNFDPAFIEKVLTHAVERLPGLEEVPVNPRRAWAGLYEMTPDHYPVLGPDPQTPGFFYACGFSGHGVMHSPASGRITADYITKGATDIVPDAEVLNIRRFAEGKLLHELAVL
ncbi:FAD-dependent oxidoreductase [Bryobacterales bacterium F-183]|nr:FAD-dependent oxidoreductase [Bryobacterales bacterium F-183]